MTLSEETLPRHALSCTCGKMRGYVEVSRRINRGICYCKDCQRYARYLGGKGLLDEQGGTQVVQTLPRYLHFDSGFEHIACVRLSSRGLLRWYAACCRTPLGNTMANSKMSFVGIPHTCLGDDSDALDRSFGPMRMRIHTASALGEQPLKSQGALAAMASITRMLIAARWDGSYRVNPFFSGDGTPVAQPVVLERLD